MGIYETHVVAQELKRGGLTDVIKELKSQAKLGSAMMKKKRMLLGYETVKKKSEVKAFYKKAGR
jgi:hypothetical protein